MLELIFSQARTHPSKIGVYHECKWEFIYTVEQNSLFKKKETSFSKGIDDACRRCHRSLAEKGTARQGHGTRRSGQYSSSGSQRALEIVSQGSPILTFQVFMNFPRFGELVLWPKPHSESSWPPDGALQTGFSPSQDNLGLFPLLFLNLFLIPLIHLCLSVVNDRFCCSFKGVHHGGLIFLLFCSFPLQKALPLPQNIGFHRIEWVP